MEKHDHNLQNTSAKAESKAALTSNEKREVAPIAADLMVFYLRLCFMCHHNLMQLTHQ